MVDRQFQVIRNENIELELFDYQRRMIEMFQQIDEKCWQKGTGYVAPHFPLVTEATSGFDDGFYLIAASANTGKSAIVMNLMYDLVSNPKNDMFALYFTLDDSLAETVVRMIAMIEKLKIDVVKRPNKYINEKELLQKRERGLTKLKNLTYNFAIIDSSEAPTIEDIDMVIKQYKMHLAEAGRENTKFVIIIDSFYDLDSRTKRYQSHTEKYDDLAKQVKDMSKQYEAIVIATAHLRKLNGYRRPIVDDVKENGVIAYEANCIILCYNEVGLKGEKADIYYLREGIPDKQPVIEMHFAKNKLSSFKGRVFVEFIPDFSTIVECPLEECKYYNSQIYQA